MRDGTDRKQAAVINSAGEASISKGLDLVDLFCGSLDEVLAIRAEYAD